MLSLYYCRKIGIKSRMLAMFSSGSSSDYLDHGLLIRNINKISSIYQYYFVCNPDGICDILSSCFIAYASQQRQEDFYRVIENINDPNAIPNCDAIRKFLWHLSSAQYHFSIVPEDKPCTDAFVISHD